MDLTNEQKCALLQTHLYECAQIERDGKPFHIENGEEKEFIIPEIDEIFRRMIEKIKKKGFTEIRKCTQSEANCIIRIFQVFHHKYDWGMYLNIYGANCFTNINGNWETFDDLGYQILDPDRYHLRKILLPDEFLFVDADIFVDFYLNIY